MALSAAGVHSGIWDCLGKIVRAEGGRAVSGLSTSSLALCRMQLPHTMHTEHAQRHAQTRRNLNNLQVRGH